MTVRHSPHPVLFPETPHAWQHWPVGVEVFFTLTGYNCVGGEFFEQYQRDTCQAIADTLFHPSNRRVFAGYRVYADGFVPAFQWYVTWPVMRRGGGEGLTRRAAMGGAAPWDRLSDDTLLEVSNQPAGADGRRQVYTLRVGGRTKSEAVENWHCCVVPFRKRLKAVLKQARIERAKSQMEHSRVRPFSRKFSSLR